MVRCEKCDKSIIRYIEDCIACSIINHNCETMLFKPSQVKKCWAHKMIKELLERIDKEQVPKMKELIGRYKDES